MRFHSIVSLLGLAWLLGTHGAIAQGADTPIYLIQGSGSTSPLVTQTVTTTGVVTRVNNNGFFIQDPIGDGNPATSDGIFVLVGSAPTVALGQLVRLTGMVVEYNTGLPENAETAANTVTELTSVSQLEVIGAGPRIDPVAINLMALSLIDRERYEGMLVSIQGPLTVAQNYFLGRFGQLTLSVNGRTEAPTNRLRPGPQALALAQENARRRLILDDGSSAQNPNPTPYLGTDLTVRAGDTLASLIGVLDYGLATASSAGAGSFKLHPTVAPVFVRQNARSAAPESVGGNIKIASFNVLNWFTTFSDGTTADGLTQQGCTQESSTSPANCRGARDKFEFERQRTKIVEAMVAINADVVGLMEIQNNGTTALQNLVDALNDRLGRRTYAPVPDSSMGAGTDAIKVAMIYKPARLARAGASVSDPAIIFNRPPLAQTFVAANGEKFTLIVNHFKSKGCSGASGADADQGDLQGCWNDRRLKQAQALRSFVARVQSSSGSNDVLLVGDINSYAQEDPIHDLVSNGFVDQIGRFNELGYSYVFDGAVGRLDQALATASMSPKITRAIEWHINADEPAVLDYNVEFKQPACAKCAPDPYSATPYRSSDHDPVVVGLNLFKVIAGKGQLETLVGTPGDDFFVSGAGAERFTGGTGVNVYSYRLLSDGFDIVTDFVPGKDQIDLRPFFARVGLGTVDPRVDGRVRVVAGLNGACAIAAGAGSAFVLPLVYLRGVSAQSINLMRDVIVR